MKRSAGILPYKIINNEIYVYLEHPGGPYWKNIEKYSICKGEYDNEKAIDAAIREFKEESGFEIKKEELIYLKSHKISNNKILTIFIINKDLDPEKMTSNTFKKEFANGEIKEFPEMDKACWLKLDEAQKYIFDSQIYFIEALKEKLKMEVL